MAGRLRSVHNIHGNDGGDVVQTCYQYAALGYAGCEYEGQKRLAFLSGAGERLEEGDDAVLGNGV